jgi:hypothetical protein
MRYSAQQDTVTVMRVARIMGHLVRVTSEILANLPDIDHAKAREVLWIVDDGLLSPNSLFICFIKFNVSDLDVC